MASAKRGHDAIIGEFEHASESDDDDECELPSSCMHVGDSVIAHYFAHAFFSGRIHSIDAQRHKVTLTWDLTSMRGCTVQPSHLVYPNAVPMADEVGVGSTVLFPQGPYTLLDDGSGGLRVQRYNEGVITSLEATYPPTATMYIGEHKHSGADGMESGYSGYSRTFRCQLPELRIRHSIFDLYLSLGSLALNEHDSIPTHHVHERAGPTSKVDAPTMASIAAPPPPAAHATPLDAYVSFAAADRPVAMRLLKQMWRSGLSANFDTSHGCDHAGVLASLRRAAVVVACASDEYVSNSRSFDELRFAKKALGKPIVPLRLDGHGQHVYEDSAVGRLLATDEMFDLRDWAAQGERPVELDTLPTRMLVRLRSLPAVQAARRARVVR